MFWWLGSLLCGLIQTDTLEYRMLTFALRWEGFTDNSKPNYRFYREERSQVPQRRKHRAALWSGEKASGSESSQPSLGFMSDQ